MTKSTKPLSDSEKHTMASKGETPLQHALAKARMFAAQERAMLGGKRSEQTIPQKK